MKAVFLLAALSLQAGCSGGGASASGDGPDATAPGDDGGGADAAADGHGPSWSGGVVDVTLDGCTPFRTANVKLGAQTFALSVDTGSATTAVAGAGCSACSSAGVETLYTPGPSARDEHKTAKGSYGTGSISWSGEVWTDTMLVGDAMPGVAVALASIASDTNFFFQTCSGVPEGVLGLGPASVAIAGTTSVVDALAATGMPDILAFQLCDRGGHVWLGGFDPASTTDAPVYAPMVASSKTQPFYNVEVSGLAVGGRPLAVAASEYGVGYVDTAGPAFYLPQAVFDALTAAIVSAPGAAAIFPSGAAWFASATTCAALARSSAELDAMLPPLAIDFGPASGAARVEIPATSSYLVSYDGAKTWCPGIVGSSAFHAGGYAFGIGDSVLRANITIFDRAGKRIGFAHQKPCP